MEQIFQSHCVKRENFNGKYFKVVLNTSPKGNKKVTVKRCASGHERWVGGSFVVVVVVVVVVVHKTCKDSFVVVLLCCL